MKNWAPILLILAGVGGTLTLVLPTGPRGPVMQDIAHSPRDITSSDACEMALLSLQRFGIARLADAVQAVGTGYHWTVSGKCIDSQGRQRTFSVLERAAEIDSAIQWLTLEVKVDGKLRHRHVATTALSAVSTR